MVSNIHLSRQLHLLICGAPVEAGPFGVLLDVPMRNPMTGSQAYNLSDDNTAVDRRKWILPLDEPEIALIAAL